MIFFLDTLLTNTASPKNMRQQLLFRQEVALANSNLKYKTEVVDLKKID